MDRSEDKYKTIQAVLITGFVLVSAILILMSVNFIEEAITEKIGVYAALLLKLAPWGGFGAIMHASFLSAQDKHENYNKNIIHEKDNASEAPNYPDDYDVLMYALYIMTGLILAILSAFLLETGIDYVASNNTSPIQDKFGLFAIFAFYAGYSQSDLVGKLKKKANESG